MTLRPYLLQQGAAQEDTRLALGALWTPGSGIAVRTGVIADNGLAGLRVTQTTAASVSVQVAPGRAVLQGASSPTVQGAYLESSDAIVTVGVLGSTGGTAPESSPRNDLIVLERIDTGYQSGTAGVTIHVVKGSASSTPVDPVLPPTCIALARVRVKAAASYGGTVVVAAADIDDLRTYTVSRGGAVPVSGATERNTLNSYAYPGFRVWRMDTSVEEVWDGSTWRALIIRPILASQLAEPPYTPVGAWTDFLAGSWAPITFVVPTSGMAEVNISGALRNPATATSSVWVAWRASGAYTRSPDISNGLSAEGNSRVYANRITMLAGLTPGGSVTITPTWQISSGSAATAQIANGQLVVKPVPG